MVNTSTQIILAIEAAPEYDPYSDQETLDVFMRRVSLAVVARAMRDAAHQPRNKVERRLRAEARKFLRSGDGAPLAMACGMRVTRQLFDEWIKAGCPKMRRYKRGG